jgi:hypothetical protein
MDVAWQIEWDERTPEAEIARRKEYCLRRLSIEIAPHLLGRTVTIRVREKIETRDDFGIPRTVYTLLARLD